MRILDATAAAVLLAAWAGTAQAQSVTFPLEKLSGDLGSGGSGRVHLSLVDAHLSLNRISLNSHTMIVFGATHDDLPAGSYRVQLAITQANAAGTLRFEGNGAQGTCAISQQLSYSGPVQTCDMGPFTVGGDGKLLGNAILTGASPQNWEIGTVTVTKLP
jgi:hypothetical protein